MTADATYLKQRVDELLGRLTGDPVAPVPSSPQSRLERLTAACSLSAAECDLLVLLAGLAVDSSVSSRLEAGCCHGGATLAQLADLLPTAGWEALAPTAALRRWHLVELDSERILTGAARIDERTLLGLLGVRTRAALIEALADHPTPTPAEVPSRRRLAAVEEVLDAWRDDPGAAPLPVVVVSGADAHATALDAVNRAGLDPLVFRASRLPTDPVEQARFSRQVERESALSAVAAIVDTTGAEAAAWAVAQRCAAPIILTYPAVAPRSRTHEGRQVVQVELSAPTTAERAETWQRELGEALAERCNGATEIVAHRFSLGEAQVARAAAEVRASVQNADTDVARELWRAARAEARPDLDVLATHVPADAAWDALVLPEPQMLMLRDLVAHVRHAHRVHEEWGFARTHSGGQGVTALFHGPSGVGKTLAARVIATELELDLYRVDLAHTVSKFIGETEKNLARIFDAADAGAAILVFDEADAIFGKRSEVKDANDRFANIEVAYLLQRLERYRGLAILTTNLPANLDTAFARRLRSSVAFPFPDIDSRKRLWRTAFPDSAPTRRLDVDALARLSVSGGSIANIALGAAVLAADARSPITMDHLLQAARSEYAKLDRTFTEAEAGAWTTRTPKARPPRARRAG